MPPKKKTIDWSSVPEEVLYEILLRLPVKSLCRCRCVSKSWFSVISDPQFMSAHFDHSLANPQRLLVSIPKYNDDCDSLSELFCSVDYAEWGIRKWRNRPQSLIADYHGQIHHESVYFRISQSVGGLGLVSYGKSLLICNPSTRESIKLPPCPGDSQSSRHNDSYLGFDPIQKKYKVLTSWIDLRSKDDCRSYVLTLGEETWRSVECKCPVTSGSINWSPKDYEFDSAGICIDGVIYYICREANASTLDLVAFDVRLETFKLISIPDEIPVELEKPTFLMESGGCVAVVYTVLRGKYQMIVMNVLIDIISNEECEWGYEEYFVPHELDRHIRVDYLVGSSPNGELVFVSNYNSNLITLDCYDLETERMKEIRVRAPKGQKRTWLSGLTTEPNFATARVYCHAERLESLKSLSPASYHYQRY